MKHTGVPKRVSFSSNDVEIIELASGKLIAKGLANHHAKAYEFSHFVADAKPTALLTHGNEVSRLWHERFGHLNFKYLQQLQKKSMVEGLPIIKTFNGICKGCIVGKHFEPKHAYIITLQRKKNNTFDHLACSSFSLNNKYNCKY